MEFQFSEYFLNLFTIPLVLMFIGTISIFGCLYDIIFNNKLILNKTMIRDTILLIFLGALLVIGIGNLKFKIIFDDKNEVNTIEGTITSLDSVTSPPRFHYKNDIVMPMILEIDGNDFYIMSIGDYEIDDEVIIEYLPNSKIVLSIKDLE